MKHGELTEIITSRCLQAFTIKDTFTSKDIMAELYAYDIDTAQLSSALSATTKPNSTISKTLIRIGKSCPHNYRLRTVVKEAPKQKEHTPLELGNAIIAYIQDLQTKANSQAELVECIDEVESLKRENARLRTLIHGNGLSIPVF